VVAVAVSEPVSRSDVSVRKCFNSIINFSHHDVFDYEITVQITPVECDCKDVGTHFTNKFNVKD
jgi:hypothetical protein